MRSEQNTALILRFDTPMFPPIILPISYANNLIPSAKPLTKNEKHEIKWKFTKCSSGFQAKI